VIGRLEGLEERVRVLEQECVWAKQKTAEKSLHKRNFNIERKKDVTKQNDSPYQTQSKYRVFNKSITENNLSSQSIVNIITLFSY